MSSEVLFWVRKSFNWPKSRNDLTHTDFDCKAAEVTEVIKKVNWKEPGRKNNRIKRQRIKENIAGQALKYNSKNCINLRPENHLLHFES